MRLEYIAVKVRFLSLRRFLGEPELRLRELSVGDYLVGVLLNFVNPRITDAIGELLLWGEDFIE